MTFEEFLIKSLTDIDGTLSGIETNTDCLSGISVQLERIADSLEKIANK